MKLTTSQLIENLSNFPTEVALAAKNQELILANLKYELSKSNISCIILKEDSKVSGVYDYRFDLNFHQAKTHCRFSSRQIEEVPFGDLLNCLLSDMLTATKSAKPKLVFQAVELPKWPHCTTETPDLRNHIMPIFRITYTPVTRLFTLKDKERDLKFKGESPNHVITDWLNHIEDLKGGYAPTYLTDYQILNKFKNLGFKMPLDILDITPLDVLFSDLASTDDPDYLNAEWRVTQLFDISAQDLRDLYDSSN